MAHGSSAALPLFTDAGADIFARNSKGQNLLHAIAAKKLTGRYFHVAEAEEVCAQEVQTFEFLMERGLSAASEDAEQRTPLDVAAAAGNAEILKLFRKEG